MFSNVQFTWSETLDAISSDSSNALTGLQPELDAALARLNSAPAVDVVNNPVAGECVGSADVLQQLRESLLARVSTLVVHPWVQGIGQATNHYSYLSTENAVIAAANKFTDIADVNKPGVVIDCAVILLTGTGYSFFAQTLKEFNAVFPLPQTLLCERRSLQLSTVENDKQLLPNAVLNSLWLKRAVSGLGCAASALSQISELSASAAGYEAGAISPNAELQALIEKKSSAISSSTAAVQSLADKFSGGTYRAHFFSAKSPQQIKNELINSGVGHDEPLACCVVLCSAVGDLKIIKEMLGL